MVPILCIVGASGSGKTTFLEALIPELARRGYRVGTVKHDVHGFEMDREGKDSFRHRAAGAKTVALASPAALAVIRRLDSEMDLREVAARFFFTEDIVIAEGYKRLPLPKVEVFRRAVEAEPLCGPRDNLLAVVTEDLAEGPGGVPVFGFSEAARLADLIEERFLRHREPRRVTVLVDGRPLPMKDFVGDFVAGGVVGMLSTLRGWEDPEHIVLAIRRRRGT